MKKITPILVLLLQFGFLQAQTYQPGKLVSSSFHEIITFEWIKNKIIIPVQINNHTYRFMVVLNK